MKQKTAAKPTRTPATPGPYLLDRLIVPRIENFAQNNDYTDIEAVAEYLRGVYREYQRHKLGPFRSQVAKAVQFIQQRGGIAKQEIQLQVTVASATYQSTKLWLLQHSSFLLLCKTSVQTVEDQHLQARLDTDRAAYSNGSSSSSDSEVASGSSDAEMDPDLGADLDQHVDNALAHGTDRQRLNSSLLNMYSSPVATTSSVPNTTDLVSEELAQSAASGAEAPAFASPQVCPVLLGCTLVRHMASQAKAEGRWYTTSQPKKSQYDHDLQASGLHAKQQQHRLCLDRPLYILPRAGFSTSCSQSMLDGQQKHDGSAGGKGSSQACTGCRACPSASFANVPTVYVNALNGWSSPFHFWFAHLMHHLHSHV